MHLTDLRLTDLRLTILNKDTYIVWFAIYTCDTMHDVLRTCVRFLVNAVANCRADIVVLEGNKVLFTRANRKSLTPSSLRHLSSTWSRDHRRGSHTTPDVGHVTNDQIASYIQILYFVTGLLLKIKTANSRYIMYNIIAFAQSN